MVAFVRNKGGDTTTRTEIETAGSGKLGKIWFSGFGPWEPAKMGTLQLVRSYSDIRKRLRAYVGHTDRRVVGRGRGCSDGVWTSFL
eukprot:scaffold140803_cov63-Phaeocystis_antarctica.AAC.1